MSDSTLTSLISHLTTDSELVTFRDSDLAGICWVPRSSLSSAVGLQDLRRFSTELVKQEASLDQTQVTDFSQVMDQPQRQESKPQAVSTDLAFKRMEPPGGHKSAKTAKKSTAAVHAKTQEKAANRVAIPREGVLEMKPTTLSLQPDTHCLVCSWRFPLQWSEQRKLQHRDLASRGDCRRDVEDYDAQVQADRQTKRLQEREKLINGGQMGEMWDVKRCPHCSISLEGRWEHFKRSHIRECSAQLLDRELSRITGSYVIPKRKQDAPTTPDPYSVSFRMLSKRRPASPH